MDEISPSNFFIVGAGFTKAVYPRAPLNDDVLVNVVGPKPDSSPLGRVWGEYGQGNIEALLTKFDLDLSSDVSKWCERDRTAINAQLAAYIHQFRFTTDVPWLHPFIALLADNDVIVSLNYDCFLEGFLDFHGAWSPKGGYHRIRNPLDDSLPDNSRNIRILKLHGSESFRAAPFFDKPDSVCVSVEISPDLFPRSAKHSHFGGGINSYPYIIAPSFVKQFVFELQYLMLDAIRFARDASNLTVIGCGLRPEDNHLWLVLTSFLKTPLWRNKRLFIVSPSASQIGDRIKKFIGGNVFSETNLVCLNSGLREALPALNERLRAS